MRLAMGSQVTSYCSTENWKLDSKKCSQADFSLSSQCFTLGCVCHVIKALSTTDVMALTFTRPSIITICNNYIT